jgi:hypothetical protein
MNAPNLHPNGTQTNTLQYRINIDNQPVEEKQRFFIEPVTENSF